MRYEAGDGGLNSEIQQFVEKYILDPTKDPSVDPNNPKSVAGRAALYAQASALQEATTAFGNVGHLGRAMANVLAAASGETAAMRAANAEKTWSETYPKLAKAGKFFLFAALVGGVLIAILGIQNWSALSKEKRAALVISCVQLFGNFVMTLGEMVNWLGKTAAERMKFLFKQRIYLSEPPSVSRTVRALDEADPHWVGGAADNMRNLLKQGDKAAESFFARFMRNFKVVMRFVAVAVAAAFAVIATIEFHDSLNDPDADAKTRAFEGIVACAAIAETVCIGLSMLVWATVFAAAGAVFAVIGVGFAMVMLFSPHDPPETPVEQFLREEVHPFVNGLDNPPEDWEPLTQTHVAAMFGLVFSPATA